MLSLRYLVLISTYHLPFPLNRLFLHVPANLCSSCCLSLRFLVPTIIPPSLPSSLAWGELWDSWAHFWKCRPLGFPCTIHYPALVFSTFSCVVVYGSLLTIHLRASTGCWVGQNVANRPTFWEEPVTVGARYFSMTYQQEAELPSSPRCCLSFSKYNITVRSTHFWSQTTWAWIGLNESIIKNDGSIFIILIRI